MTNVIIGEFVGTILRVLLGDCVCANVTLNNSGFKAAGALFIALGWGLAIAERIYHESVRPKQK